MSDISVEAPAAASAATRRRSVTFWLLFGGIVIVVALVAMLISTLGRDPGRGSMDPDATAPEGARALVEILREHGVRVDVVRSLTSAQEALADAPGATLVITATTPLADDDLAQVAGEASHVVLLRPSARDLRVLADGSTPAGATSGAADARCEVAEAERAERISLGRLFAPEGAFEGCFGADDGYAMLSGTVRGTRIDVIDGTAVFANDALTEEGNAALAVGLLGRSDRLVWYVPSLSDSALPGGAPTLGELTPPWVTPAILVLIAAAATAAIWRGRRFGPLVAENLPVMVRAQETTEGRARLYARAPDPVHALDQLRIGAIRRMAGLVGLGPTATAHEVADAVAATLGYDRRDVRTTLIDAVPETPAELVDLADTLRSLETILRAAVRPERKHL